MCKKGGRAAFSHSEMPRGCLDCQSKSRGVGIRFPGFAFVMPTKTDRENTMNAGTFGGTLVAP
jgi:hypothetical protein